MGASPRHATARPRRATVAHAPALAALIQSLSGSRLRIGVLDGAALSSGETRPVLSAKQLLLARRANPDPNGGVDSETRRNERTLALAIAAHASAHLLFSEAARPVTGLKPMGVAVVSAIEDARVEALLCARFPGALRWFRPWAALGDTRPEGSFANRIARLGRALLDPDYADDDYWIGKARRLFAQCAQESGLGDYWAFRRLGSVLANDLGQLRVRFNPAEFVVPLAYRDDNSFLWSDPKAAQLVVGAPDLTGESAPQPPSTLSEPGAQTSPRDRSPAARDLPDMPIVRYPEWDYRSGIQRPGWCTVIESIAAAPGGDHQRLPAGSRPRRVAMRQISAGSRVRRRRQPDGDWLDLDAAIRNVIDRRLALDSDERHYVRRDRRAQTVSLLLLLDLSASANDVVDAVGSSLVALTRAAALSLVEALANEATRVAVHGFRSDTRSRVQYERFLDFGSSLDEAARTRLQSATARESTRMGAALRHALRFLAQETSERRLLIVLSDGEPSDIDVFDPRYLARDAARAVLDLRRSGIDVCCVTPTPAQALTAREVFGSQNVLRVPNASTLALALARFVDRRIAE